MRSAGNACGMPYEPDDGLRALVRQLLSLVHILSRHGICDSEKPSPNSTEQPSCRLPVYASHDDGTGPLSVGRGCDRLDVVPCARRAASSACCAWRAAAAAAAAAACCARACAACAAASSGALAVCCAACCWASVR